MDGDASDSFNCKARYDLNTECTGVLYIGMFSKDSPKWQFECCDELPEHGDDQDCYCYFFA